MNTFITPESDRFHRMDSYWQPPLFSGLPGGYAKSARSRLRSWSLWPTTAMAVAVDPVGNGAAAGDRSLGGPRSGGEGEW